MNILVFLLPVSRTLPKGVSMELGVGDAEMETQPRVQTCGGSDGLPEEGLWPFCDMAWDANEGRFKSRSGRQRASGQARL